MSQLMGNILLDTIIIIGGILFVKTGTSRDGFPVPQLGGYLFCIFGIYRVVIHVFLLIRSSKKMAGMPNRGSCLKCISCGEVFLYTAEGNPSCPKCGGMAEDIKGFFERHPEHKDENDQLTRL